MALFVNWLESLYMENSVTDKCLRQKNLKASCSKCIEVCSQEALVIKVGKVELNNELCNGCGACIVACPLSAISGSIPNRHFENGSLVYDESFIPAIKELLIYKKRGMTSVLLKNGIDCSKWDKAVKEANDLLLQIGEESVLCKQESKKKKYSRRGFLASVQKQGRRMAKELTPASWRTITDWNLANHYPDRQFYHVEINTDSCTLCRSCMILCPQKVFSQNGFSISVENSKCVNCRLCTDICPETALTIIVDARTKTVSDYQFTENTCGKCGTPFMTFQQDQKACTICDDRDPTWLQP